MRNHPIILFIFLCFVALKSTSQTAEIDNGDKAFEIFDFQQALFFFENANDATPGDPNITRRIANTYRRMGRTVMAAEWFQKTLELDASNPADMLSYAEILKNMQQYDEAIQWYEMYAQLKPTDLRAISHLKDKNYYRDLFADTSRYEMKKFAINGENPVLGISLFEDEKFLVSAVQFGQTSKAAMEINPYLDVYLCEMNKENELQNPILLDKNVNSDFHDGPAYYCFADKTLYITRTNMKGKKPKFNRNGNAILKIFESKYEGGKWSEAKEMKMNEDGFSNGQPCLSKDGQTMYFFSDRDGGMGGTDLYVCYKSGNGWSQPINLGPNVNTEGNEQFPFLGEDGFLYFASNGHAGLGGMDVFSSDQIGEVWQTPLNLGAPINSSADDFSVVYDKESDNGFFCSNRSGGGDDDLFFYKHVSIKNMIIAGTIKANVPNISLAGERIQITKVNSGEVSYQALDEFENFEFSANAGDQIEIVMMDAEYFDHDKPVISYEVVTPIMDPFVNLGEQRVELKKLPMREGQLSLMKQSGLKISNTTLPVADANRVGKLEEVDIDASANTNDETLLNITSDKTLTKAEEKLEADYAAKIKTADQFFANKYYAEASKLYAEASAMKPGETYPKQKLTACKDASSSNSMQANYDKKIAQADALFATKKYKEASKTYQEASVLMPDEAYAKQQLTKCNSALSEATDNAFQSKISAADKLFEQQKWGEAKAAYMTAIQMNPADVYPKNQMALIDDKIKLAEAEKIQKKYDDKIEEADKLFSQRKYAEAKAAYKAAAALKPNDAYAQKGIENIDNILTPKKKEAASSTDNANKKKGPSDFELAIPAVDLVGLSLDNVIFDFNKAFVREEDKLRLDQLYNLMLDNPTTKLLIRAHCDSRGSLAYNQSLSMSRAMAVQGYLMQKGIKRDRVKTEWFGEQRPLNGCIDNVPCEENQYEVNRRAEFKLVAQ